MFVFVTSARWRRGEVLGRLVRTKRARSSIMIRDVLGGGNSAGGLMNIVRRCGREET